MPQSKTRISSKELIRNFGALSDLALREPVVITKNGRDRLVLLSLETFETLERSNGASQGRAGSPADENVG